MAKGRATPPNRRAFRNDRIRALFDKAVDAGWTHRYGGDGHVQMASPDGKTRMSLSTTASDAARGVQNAEAIWKRWVRLQNAMTIATGIPPAHRHAGEAPMQEQTRPEVTGDETTVVNESEEAQMEGQIEPTKPEDNPPTRYLCADGCGKVVSKEGGYAKGHNPNSQANASKARAAKNGRSKGPSLFKSGSADTFTIDEVITVATYGGTSGLIEVAHLKRGLEMVLEMRGER
jgi:hypothetical protein